MIWTHSFNTFLSTDLKASPTYHEMSFYHGLVAPIFFWVAGFMRGMAAARPGPVKPAWPTVKRLAVIWIVGCFMHMPWGSLIHGTFDSNAWRVLLQCDVLNCLALSSAVLLGIEQMMGLNKTKAWMVVALIGLAVVVATDWAGGVQTGIIPLDALLSKRTGSPFPMFPWFGFACAGFLMGNFGAPTWHIGIAAAVVAFGIPWIPGETGTIAFYFERLGWVVMIAAAVAHLNPFMNAMPRWLKLAGRESLWLYVVHLMFIHAVPWWSGQTLEHLIGATQKPLTVVLIFIALLLSSLMVAWLNERRKLKVANV